MREDKEQYVAGSTSDLAPRPAFEVPAELASLIVREMSNTTTIEDCAALKIIHYIGSLGAGGAERQLCNLVIDGARRGRSAAILTAGDLEGSNDYFLPLLQRAGIPVRHAGSRFSPLLREVLSRAEDADGNPLPALPDFLLPHTTALFGELLLDPPDILHGWLDLTNIWAGVAGLLADVPMIVLSTRNMNPTNFPYLNHAWFKPWYQLLASSTRVHFINNSRAGARSYADWLGVDLDRFEVIVNGVDTSSIQRPTATETADIRRELGCEIGGQLLVGVFRLSEEKQPLFFVEVAVEALRKHPRLRVVIIGSGPMEAQLLEAIKASGVQDRIRHFGRRSDATAIVAASDIMLLTSRYEGTPNVVLEAQCLGCPVVATKAGGTEDAVNHGKTGFLLDVDDQHGLVAALDTLLTKSQLRRQMATAGPRFVAEKFGLSAMVDHTFDLYQRRFPIMTALPRQIPNPAFRKPLLQRGLIRLGRSVQRFQCGRELVEKLRRLAPVYGSIIVPPKLDHLFLTRAKKNAAQNTGSADLRNRPLRVTHYIGSLGPGGSERQLCNLALASVRRGLSVRVLTATDPIGDAGYYAETLQRAGIEPLKAGNKLSERFKRLILKHPILDALHPIPPFLLPHTLDVLAEIISDPPDVLHAWLDLTNIWAGVAGVLAEVPLIVLSTRSVNPTHFPQIDNPWFQEWYRRLAAYPQVQIINNSTAGADDYARWLTLPSASIKVVRNGVDLDAIVVPSPDQALRFRRELGMQEEGKLVIGVFRLSEEKQPMVFFEAMRRLLAQRPTLHVALIGRGQFEQDLRDAVGHHSLEKRFHLLGQRRDVNVAMSAADILVLTSREEGTPNVILEAQWLGCPVISTRAGGAVDALDPGATGELVDVGDVAAISAAILRVLDDDSARRAMALRGPAFVREHFSLERMVDETLSLYRARLYPHSSESPVVSDA